MRTNRSEYVANNALSQSVANRPVRVVRKPTHTPVVIRWGLCVTVATFVVAAAAIIGGAL